MYAACSFAVGQVADIPGIVAFAWIETWIALGATALALAGLARSVYRGWPWQAGTMRSVLAARAGDSRVLHP